MNKGIETSVRINDFKFFENRLKSSHKKLHALQKYSQENINKIKFLGKYPSKNTNILYQKHSHNQLKMF